MTGGLEQLSRVRRTFETMRLDNATIIAKRGQCAIMPLFMNSARAMVFPPSSPSYYNIRMNVSARSVRVHQYARVFVYEETRFC